MLEDVAVTARQVKVEKVAVHHIVQGLGGKIITVFMYVGTASRRNTTINHVVTRTWSTALFAAHFRPLDAIASTTEEGRELHVPRYAQRTSEPTGVLPRSKLNLLGVW